MKKLLLSLAIAFGAINSGFAADLYVNNSGQSGTYTTIQAAINAASTGDNIFVSPLNTYQESLSITKSIRIASSLAGSRIIVTQDIKISPLANILVELIGIEGLDVILDTQTSTLGPNTRGKAIISDCFFSDIDLGTNYLTILVFKCNVSGSISGNHGKIIGNTVDGDITINDEPNIGIGDTVLIKANDVFKIVSYTDDHSVIIQNNKAHQIYISNWKGGLLVNGLISNNTILTEVPSSNVSWSSPISGSHRIFITTSSSNSQQDMSNMEIVNNALICPANNPNRGAYSNRHYYRNSFINYNYATTNPVVAYNLYFKGNNITGSYNYYYYGSAAGIFTKEVVNSTLSYPISESEINNLLQNTYKDLGSPSPKFQDSDLSRADYGHRCGDNSYEAFHGTSAVLGKAYIIDLNLPSEIWPGQTVNLKAEAVHTN